jgi:soluble lytic murein transglycosylase-like protein
VTSRFTISRRAWLAGAACAPAHVLAGTEPVYVSRDESGRLAYTNEPLSAESTLLLVAGSREVVEFRRRFRAELAEGPALAPKRRLELMASVDALVESIARRERLDPNLLRAVITVESGFKPWARSSAGAVGLMQLMPATARRFGVTDRTDPGQNISGGARYLRELLQLFSGDVRLALAGYNAGEGNVIKHGRRVPPFPETQKYVPAVIAAWKALRRAN